MYFLNPNMFSIVELIGLFEPHKIEAIQVMCNKGKPLVCGVVVLPKNHQTFFFADCRFFKVREQEVNRKLRCS